MYSKKNQTKKIKNDNPKKMSSLEYKLYVDFVNGNAGYMCQCECGRPATQIHHSQFGAGGRDDRFITAISEICHYTIHHGTNTDEAIRLKLLFKGIGRDNWRNYNDQKVFHNGMGKE